MESFMPHPKKIPCKQKICNIVEKELFLPNNVKTEICQQSLVIK